LVVDANPNVRNLFHARLTEQGCDYRGAATRDEAVRLYDSFRPDVVLFDVEAVEVGSYEAVRRLPESVFSQRAWLVALTGRSREVGFDLLLAKPFEGTALDTLLRACAAATLTEFD